MVSEEPARGPGTVPAPMRRSRLWVFLEMIKFEHTLFALPFAYLGMLLAARGWPGLQKFLWITVAMISARTAAMAFNRFADREMDAHNPRTAQRALPQGLFSPTATLVVTGTSLLVLALAAWRLNPLCLYLLPLAGLFLIGYSYTKRFTWLSHWILGVTDGIAVAGAWIAVRGRFEALTFFLWFAVTVWIAGFDLIYACQDVDYDREYGLWSLPACSDVATALRWARINHALMMAALFATGILSGLTWPFWVGLAVIAALLVHEHRLVSPDDLSRLDVAFFDMNGYISLIALAAVALGLFV